MIQLLKTFFADIHEIRLYLTLRPESRERFIVLDSADRTAITGALTNYRRNKPRVKKEVVDAFDARTS